jgi:tripartite-type tricarboxylate transporter receptor subunit TctC
LRAGYRIGDPDGAYPIFDATASRLYPGRWNTSASPMIYASEHGGTNACSLLDRRAKTNTKVELARKMLGTAAGHLAIAAMPRRSASLWQASMAGALLSAVAITTAVRAQPGYPNHPVQFVVPYGAGGVADVGMRILADSLTARLKQPFVVENRPGAGGIVAAKAAATAAPDGYTLLMTGNNNAISASLFKSLPYNILTDFASASTASFFDLLIVTRAGSPLKSVADVVSTARAKAGRLNIASTNPGSTQNLAAELFKSTTAIEAAIIPFRTSSDMATALLRGDVDIAFEFYAATQGLIADRKVVALASAGPKRTSYLPHVPTVEESGIKDFQVVSWNGISVPAATPKAVVEVLTRAINEVLPSPDVQERAGKLGMEMRGSTPEAMTERMKNDIAKWAAVIEKAGIAKHE